MTDPPSRLTAALANRCRIERPLGDGGMATLYLAEDLRHQRRVAIKVMKPELAVAVGAERFLPEIHTTADLRHPHVLPPFDPGDDAGFLESLEENLAHYVRAIPNWVDQMKAAVEEANR
jgi:serine/threonine-protein kinase